MSTTSGFKYMRMRKLWYAWWMFIVPELKITQIFYKWKYKKNVLPEGSHKHTEKNWIRFYCTFQSSFCFIYVYNLHLLFCLFWHYYFRWFYPWLTVLQDQNLGKSVVLSDPKITHLNFIIISWKFHNYHFVRVFRKLSYRTKEVTLYLRSPLP